MGRGRARGRAPALSGLQRGRIGAGTFKDRVLMEEDPFAVVEAMTIAAFATGCERATSISAVNTRWRPNDCAMPSRRHVAPVCSATV
jgi:hypothetical protein